MPNKTPEPFRGIAAGVAAGIVAGLVMNLFQKGWSKVIPQELDSDPATVKAAQKISRATTGDPITETDKGIAGSAVHYGFGALLGGAYGLIAEYWPAVTTGRGTLFGAAASLFDELGVPAAGLGPSPTQTKPATHAYAVASHVLFGGVTEATRRLARAG